MKLTVGRTYLLRFGVGSATEWHTGVFQRTAPASSSLRRAWKLPADAVQYEFRMSTGRTGYITHDLDDVRHIADEDACLDESTCRCNTHCDAHNRTIGEGRCAFCNS